MQELKHIHREIQQAMEFCVPEGALQSAEDVLDIYRDDRLGLGLLHEFYTNLPEAKEAYVQNIVVLSRHRGIFLLGAMISLEDGYLYLVSSEGIEFQGRLSDGYLAQEALDFFEFESPAAFKKLCATPEQLEMYEPLQVDASICPACHVPAGEIHELGCPVEVCPWCGGQLIHCSCRYDQLGLDAISTEEELIRLEELLEERGRIPYSEEQRPNFADEGPGVIFE
ncbi:hypothetical protein [Desulfogranum japonicum]|uniref:hypothetical protein n=1 Tax=Desulfogranum japonicum TaxID=231447 RepID=UPI0003F56E1B|nr:hypothetical protein [Desulfogranum japonicum]